VITPGAGADVSVGSKLSVSAVIPCYNGAQWLAEAIQSVQAQTRPVDEIIVVDDASSDQSNEIAHKLGALVLTHSTNRGEGAARNTGIQQASGNVIAWLDADDFWLPHHVETLAGLLEQYPQATAAFAGVQRFGSRDEFISGWVPVGSPSNCFWLAFRDWLHILNASLIRREALLEIGGFDTIERYSVDFDLWLRLSRAHLFVCTREVTSYWRWHDEQQSRYYTRQIATLYRYRRRLLEREWQSGNRNFANEIERRMRETWEEELASAWDDKHLALFHFLQQLAPLIPGLSLQRQLHWTSLAAKLCPACSASAEAQLLKTVPRPPKRW
jgi:glycosyltransferase involved in cell wall biosynthesis